MQFLGFRLSGAMASWGDVTVGDIRSSWAEPSGSALTGLVAAALGVRREDEAGQARLAALRFAVRMDRPGAPLRDYHTVQAAQTDKRGEPFRTRRDELTRGKVHAKLTDRTYYVGQKTTVLAWGGDLEAIADALRKPAFFLCLGRRSCPPTAPLAPALVAAETLVDGFTAYDAAAPDADNDPPPTDCLMVWDDRLGRPDPGLGNEATERRERRDVPLNRGPDWSFAPRPVGSGRYRRSEP